MPRVELYLDHYNFYCPVTGIKVLDKEDQISSPAMLFSFLEGNSELENANEESVSLFESIIRKQKRPKNDIGRFQLAFEQLCKDVVDQNANVVLFSLHFGGSLGGDVCHMVFNMNYSEDDFDEDSDDNYSPYNWTLKVSELHDILLKTNKSYPIEHGYAAFITDDMGAGVFHFCSSLEEWDKLMPGLVFIEKLDNDTEVIDLQKVQEKYSSVYCSYMESKMNMDEDYFENFMKYTNEVLDRHSILFAGPVSELFIPNTEFIIELIEEFGKDPSSSVTEYLEFLHEYVIC